MHVNRFFGSTNTWHCHYEVKFVNNSDIDKYSFVFFVQRKWYCDILLINIKDGVDVGAYTGGKRFFYGIAQIDSGGLVLLKMSIP